MSRSWTIGALPGCDLVVDAPFVSGCHCLLTLDAQGYSLEDLGSANGTYVNGVRISEKVRISVEDAVTLGRTVRMPWPAKADLEVPKHATLRIGRDPDNDLMIDLPIISGHHARVIWEGRPGEATIEDLGSSNGTAVGSPDCKSARSIFRGGDTIYLGTHAVQGSELLERVESLPVPTADPSPVATTDSHSPLAIDLSLRTPIGQTSLTGFLRHSLRSLGLLSQAPLLAVAICAIFGSSTPATPGASNGLASVLFWLGLSALWFGLSNAVIGEVLGARRTPEESKDASTRLRRLGMSSGLGVLQCLVLWIIVSGFLGLRGSWLLSATFLILASEVGFALGCLIVSLALRPPLTWAGLALVMVLLWLFGGGPQSLPRSVSWVKVASDFVPSRWVFEGLLLKSGRLASREVAGKVAHDEERDPAEDFFPAKSDRMGTRADAMALFLMLLGLSAAAIFAIWGLRANPAASSTP